MRISLICATYGRSAELDSLLNSLQAQNFKNFEVIIVDQNKDGLITIEDLTNLLGIRSKNNDYNPLITQDVLKIHGYVEKMKSRGDPVLDDCDR